MILFYFIAMGIVSGLLGGLLGIGGGVVTVPALYFVFTTTHILSTEVMQIAVGTSLATGFITSSLATYIQYKKKAIHYPVAKFLLPGLFFGCMFGAVLGDYLSSEWLSRIFGTMAILLGLYFSIPRLPHPYIRARPDQTLSLFGILIGALSSMLGIGGGSIAFPVLLGYQVPVKNASATSSVSTFITTLFGTIAYLIIAKEHPPLPDSFGYIYLPAFFGISVGVLIATPIGVKLVHTLDTALVKRIFGCCLTFIGLYMLFY